VTERPRPRWPYLGRSIDYAEAVAIQERGQRRVIERWSGPPPDTVAGIDIAVGGGEARAAVVVHALPSLEETERSIAVRPLDWPYIPGLLAFREVPAIVAAFEGLRSRPDLALVDGHGRAHPRRYGVACMLGVELDLPTIGVGKSRLVGEHREPAHRRGSRVQLRHADEVIGVVLRTRDGVRPVFVSVGHRIDLDNAVRLVLRCAPRFRLPEPIRAADRAAGCR